MAKSENTSDSPTAPRPDDIKPVQIGGESFADRLLPHIKKIVIAVAVAAAVVIVIMFVMWLRERGRTAETDQFAQIAEVAARPVRAEGQEPEKNVVSFASGKERAAAVLDAIAKHSSSVTTDAYRGAMEYGAEQYDKAIASFRKGSAAAGIDGVLAREGLALALEAKASAEKDAGAKQKGLEEALAAARAIQPDANGPRRVYSLYHEARLLVLLGKTAEARALFEKVRTMSDDNNLKSLAEARLAGLEAS